MRKILPIILVIATLSTCLTACKVDESKQPDQTEQTEQTDPPEQSELPEMPLFYTGISNQSAWAVGPNTDVPEEPFRLVIPEEVDQRPVTSIPAEAFSSYNYMVSAEIPGSIIGINHSAFKNCTGLESVRIAHGTERIDSVAFLGCTSLTQVVLPNSISFLGRGLFAQCPLLTEITYQGTCAEWEAIEMEVDEQGNNLLFLEASVRVVHCTDGDIMIGE